MAVIFAFLRLLGVHTEVDVDGGPFPVDGGPFPGGGGPK